MRQTRSRHWRPGLVDIAAFAVSAVIVAVLVVSAVSSADEATAPSAPTEVVSARAASVLAGLAVLVTMHAAISSGVRGGPVALGSATVLLVLLAPVDRHVVLRSPATRQVVAATLAGASVGAASWAATANQVARPRDQLEVWILTGSVVGATAAGLALLIAGLRLSGRLALVVRTIVVVWWAVDAALDTVTSPVAAAAHLLVAGFDGRAAAYVLAVAVGVASVGVLRAGGLSVERAWRRTAAADQLRLAISFNDLRTAVLVLRRRSQERPRTRPWRRLGGPWTRRHPIATRSLRGLLRWPIVRVGRFLSLAVVTGGLAAASGSAPVLVVAACVLAYVAALDASDALAQELDHPDLRRGFPIAADALSLRHVPVPLAIMTGFCGIAGGIAGLVNGPTVAAVALLASPALALAAMAGATLTASRSARPLVTILDYGRPVEIVVPRAALKVAAPVVPLLMTAFPMVLELRHTVGVAAVAHGVPGVAASMAMLAFVLLRDRLSPLR